MSYTLKNPIVMDGVIIDSITTLIELMDILIVATLNSNKSDLLTHIFLKASPEGLALVRWQIARHQCLQISDSEKMLGLYELLRARVNDELSNTVDELEKRNNREALK